ncbi:MAG: 30S ribosomal protein S21 [Nanoarchaeota archaeon]|nr:30S ribosomal protein S21 [Nanoarchaeota archaeon]
MARYYRKREFKKREWGQDRQYRCEDPILLEVVFEENDTTEKLIRRFLKKFKKIRLMDEIKEHEFYVKPSIKRRLEKKRKESLIRRAQEENDLKDD